MLDQRRRLVKGKFSAGIVYSFLVKGFAYFCSGFFIFFAASSEAQRAEQTSLVDVKDLFSAVPSGNASRIVGLMSDITARKRVEEAVVQIAEGLSASRGDELLRKLVRAAHPALAVDNIRSMHTRIADSLITRRSPALLAGIFAGVALLLAAIGTYGVLSYAVAQRRREIGIRMALGAQREQIGAQFLSLGLRLLAAGTILGLIGAWLAGRAMQSILFDVPTLHVATLFGTALVMTAVSLVACLIPARRATKVDPIEALRAE
jgi:hypothetical protein